MVEINLLDKYPKSKRPVNERSRRRLNDEAFLSRLEERNTVDILIEQQLLDVARKFGREYFDGDRLYGYGGYYYNPRFWTKTVRRFRDYYNLKGDASILDIGCAKGYMIYDFKKLMPEISVAGIDISQYAYDNAIEEMKPFIKVGNARSLPHSDKAFDLVISINTVDHLPLEDCKTAIREIQRVTKRHAFITVNSWRTERERQQLLKWNITAATIMHVEDWKKLFEEVGYTGDYWWFIID